jgi:Peptidase E
MTGLSKIEPEEIDREIIRLSGKKHPKVLFIPTASGDSPLYYETFKKYYGEKMGFKTDVLYLLKTKPSLEQIKEKILNSDIVYIGRW